MIPLNADTISQLVKYDTMILVFLLILAFSYLRKLKLLIENAASKEDVDRKFKDLELNVKTEMYKVSDRVDLFNNQLEKRISKFETFVTDKIIELSRENNKKQ